MPLQKQAVQMERNSFKSSSQSFFVRFRVWIDAAELSSTDFYKVSMFRLSLRVFQVVTNLNNKFTA